MDLNLAEQSLRNLQDDFRCLSREGRLRAVLIESPVVVKSVGSGQGNLPANHQDRVWEQAFVYRAPAVLQRVEDSDEDETQPEQVERTPLYYRTGEPAIDESGECLAFTDVGATRTVLIEGDRDLWMKFRDLAVGVGEILKKARSPVIDRLPRQTCYLDAAEMCWICAVFDLAWAGLPGSPLTPETDKSVWFQVDPDLDNPGVLAGDLLTSDVLSRECIRDRLTPELSDMEGESGETEIVIPPDHPSEEDLRRRLQGFRSKPYTESVSLEKWSDYVASHPRSEAFVGVSDPPEWYSTIRDIASGSVWAIDIILTDIKAEMAPPKASASQQPPPRAVDETPHKSPSRLPKKPSDAAIKAYQVDTAFPGMTQEQIAERMTKEGYTMSQAQVSRSLKAVREYREAGGIIPPIVESHAQPQSMNPNILDMGERQDRRTPRQREKFDSDDDRD